MLNGNTRLSAIYDALLPAMMQAAQYVTPEQGAAIPAGGTPEATAYNETLTTIHKCVESAIEVTNDKRVGKYNVIQTGEKVSACQDTAEIDEGIYSSKRSYFNLFKRYDGYAPIFGRKYRIDRADTKINNHLSNDFFGEICDDKASFVLGTPAWYKSSDAAQDVTLQEFVTSADLAEVDLDTMTLSTICGVSYRYYWIGDDSLSLALIAPWDVILFDMQPERIGIILSKSGDSQYAEIFGAGIYIRMKMDAPLDAELKYSFLGCPIVAYPNNPQWQSDCGKVLELMDAYDRIVSDCSNEVEQLRLAYLVIEGALQLIGKEAFEFSEQLKQTGIIQTPEGTSANFISKSMQMDAILSLLTLLENNIYRFTKSVNYNNKTAGEQPTAFALEQRLAALKNKCMRSWMSFDNGNHAQWDILAKYQDVTNGPAIDPALITSQPRYNIPINLQAAVATVAQLMTIVSKETALKQLPIFDSDEAIQAELVRMMRDGVDPNMLDEEPEEVVS